VIARLLAAVGRRIQCARIARYAFVALIAISALQAAILVACRCTGLISNIVTLSTLAIPPLAALAVGVLVAAWGRLPPRSIARVVDRHLGSCDLVLTAHGISGSPGAYQAVVLARAAQRCRATSAQAVLPFMPARRLAIAAGMMLVLAALVAWLPQFDPFGQQAERIKIAERQHRIADAQAQARARIDLLSQSHTDQPVSESVQRELAKLTQTLATLKNTARDANRTTLSAESKDLGKAFTQAQANQFTPNDEGQDELQRLGAGDLTKSDDLSKELAKGSSRAVQEQISALQSLSEKMAASGSSTERQRLRDDLKQGIERLASSLGKQGMPANQALHQAMDQLAQSGNQALSQQALSALKDSLELAGAELSQVAQGARDVNQLKDALQTLQMARTLNELGDLAPSDGGDGESPSSLADYKKMYAKAMRGHGKGQKEGEGEGMGDQGNPARGGHAPENDNAQTVFDPQRSRSALGPGATLLQWKTSGPADRGVATEEYQRSLHDIQQAASEALLHEQLPPGYQDAVKKYFDSLAVQPAAPTAP
jgi:hypothetical protein